MKRLLLSLLFIAMAPSIASAQVSADNGDRHPAEIAFQYNYVRSNAPPAACDCFSLNGGSVSVAQPIGSGKFAFAFDAGFAHGTSTGSYDLLLSTFTAGVRYRPAPRARWSPFGEILAGTAHASGSLVEGPTPAASDPTLLVATIMGGGLDRKLSPRWSLRLIEADYLLTTFSNGVNDHQNNLRLSAGMVFRFR